MLKGRGRTERRRGLEGTQQLPAGVAADFHKSYYHIGSVLVKEKLKITLSRWEGDSKSAGENASAGREEEGKEGFSAEGTEAWKKRKRPRNNGAARFLVEPISVS